MKNKKIGIIKNKNGSALPFVIIIGLILMLLVGSLTSVAVSGINYTQSSVESRQAYVDAKSVIEYGKVLIDQKITDMKASALPNQASAGELVIFNINGSHPNPSEPLTFATGPTIGIVKLKWTPTQIVTDPITKAVTATTPYTLTVETQDLRRKLDYQTSFDYIVVTTTITGTTLPLPPVPGLTSAGSIELKNNGDLKYDGLSGYSNVGISSSKTADGVYHLNPNYAQFNDCVLGLASLSIVDSATNNPIPLDIAAGKIVVTEAMPSVNNPTYWFGRYSEIFESERNNAALVTTDTLYFRDNYTPDTNGTTCVSNNTLHAKNIIVLGDLTLNPDSLLDIHCDNLWITGALTVNGVTIDKDSTYTLADLADLGIITTNVSIGGVPAGAGGTLGSTTTTVTVYQDQGNYY